MDLQELMREIEGEDERRRSLAALPLIDVGKPRRFRPKQLILPMVALLVAGGSLAVSTGLPGENQSIPRHLIGWWNSDDARYVNRGFRITGSTLTLAMPDSGLQVMNIMRVNATEDRRSTVYEIEYEDAEGNLQYFGFQYSTDSLIRFRNQSGMAWYKGDDPTSIDTAQIDSTDVAPRPSGLSTELAECVKTVTAQRTQNRPVSCLRRESGS